MLKPTMVVESKTRIISKKQMVLTELKLTVIMLIRMPKWHEQKHK